MEKKVFQTKWYYRLLKVIFYFAFTIALLINIGTIIVIVLDLYFGIDTGSSWHGEDIIFGLLWLPTIVLFFGTLKSLFYYILFGKWEFGFR